MSHTASFFCWVFKLPHIQHRNLCHYLAEDWKVDLADLYRNGKPLFQINWSRFPHAKGSRFWIGAGGNSDADSESAIFHCCSKEVNPISSINEHGAILLGPMLHSSRDGTGGSRWLGSERSKRWRVHSYPVAMLLGRTGLKCIRVSIGTIYAVRFLGTALYPNVPVGITRNSAVF